MTVSFHRLSLPAAAATGVALGCWLCARFLGARSVQLVTGGVFSGRIAAALVVLGIAAVLWRAVGELAATALFAAPSAAERHVFLAGKSALFTASLIGFAVFLGNPVGDITHRVLVDNHVELGTEMVDELGKELRALAAGSGGVEPVFDDGIAAWLDSGGDDPARLLAEVRKLRELSLRLDEANADLGDGFGHRLTVLTLYRDPSSASLATLWPPPVDRVVSTWRVLAPRDPAVYETAPRLTSFYIAQHPLVETRFSLDFLVPADRDEPDVEVTILDRGDKPHWTCRYAADVKGEQRCPMTGPIAHGGSVGRLALLFPLPRSGDTLQVKTMGAGWNEGDDRLRLEPLRFALEPRSVPVVVDDADGVATWLRSLPNLVTRLGATVADRPLVEVTAEHTGAVTIATNIDPNAKHAVVLNFGEEKAGCKYYRTEAYSRDLPDVWHWQLRDQELPANASVAIDDPERVWVLARCAGIDYAVLYRRKDSEVIELALPNRATVASLGSNRQRLFSHLVVSAAHLDRPVAESVVQTESRDVDPDAKLDSTALAGTGSLFESLIAYFTGELQRRPDRLWDNHKRVSAAVLAIAPLVVLTLWQLLPARRTKKTDWE